MQLSNLVWVDMLLIHSFCRAGHDRCLWRDSQTCFMFWIVFAFVFVFALFFLLIHCLCRVRGRYRERQSKPFHIFNCVFLSLNRRLNHITSRFELSFVFILKHCYFCVPCEGFQERQSNLFHILKHFTSTGLRVWQSGTKLC